MTIIRYYNSYSIRLKTRDFLWSVSVYCKQLSVEPNREIKKADFDQNCKLSDTLYYVSQPLIVTNTVHVKLALTVAHKGELIFNSYFSEWASTIVRILYCTL